MVGDYFCTHIPDNDEDGHIIDRAILHLTALQRAMTSNLHPRSDWFQELLSSWKPFLVQILLYTG